MTGGEAPGSKSFELLREPLQALLADCRERVAAPFAAQGLGTLDDVLPYFAGRMWTSRRLASQARARRKDMPVISEEDLADLNGLLHSLGLENMCDHCHGRPMELAPTQCQIYVDKCLDGLTSRGPEASRAFLLSSPLVIDHIGQIVDGHHRWLSGMLQIPDEEVPLWRLPVTVDELMPRLIAFSDARHARNA